MFLIFWTEHGEHFCIISDFGNLFNKNKQKLSLTQKKSSSEEFLKEKRKTF